MANTRASAAGDPEIDPKTTEPPPPAPEPQTDDEPEGDEENGEPEDDSTTGKLLEELGIERGQVNQRYDGETDPAYVIKMQNQKRVYEQAGKEWPPVEEPETPPEEPAP